MTEIDFNAANKEEEGSEGEQLQQTATLDPEKARETLREKFLPLIEEMATQAENHQITDDEAYRNASALAGEAKELAKKLDKARKEVIAEPDGFVRQVNKFTKTFRDRLDSIESGLKRKVEAHAREIEQERREQERKAKEEAERVQADLNKKAEETGTDPVEVAPPVVEQQKTTRADTGAAVHLRKEWTWEIQDISQIPADYLEVKTTAVNKAVKAGIREIPGINIYETEKAVLRS